MADPAALSVGNENINAIREEREKDLNSHYIKNEWADLFYTYTIKLAKELVFDMCTELLEYAAWMTE